VVEDSVWCFHFVEEEVGCGASSAGLSQLVSPGSVGRARCVRVQPEEQGKGRRWRLHACEDHDCSR
jgi:hypothetical protein